MLDRVNNSLLVFAGYLISLIAGANIALGQVGIDTTLWEFIPGAEHHVAVVQVNSGNGIGTGVIIRVDMDKPVADGFEGYCLTAYHVVANDNNQRQIRIKYQNGRGAKECKVVAFDEKNDIAIVWVWVPQGLSPAIVAENSLAAGQPLQISGLGGGSELECCIRHFQAESTFPTNENTIFANVPLLPGDSGGPGFNVNGHVVGIVSGGWFWIDGAVTDREGREVKTTWPARLSNTKPINDLLADID